MKFVYNCADCGTRGHLKKFEMFICNDDLPRCPKCSVVVAIKVASEGTPRPSGGTYSTVCLVDMMLHSRDSPRVLSAWIDKGDLWMTMAIKRSAETKDIQA